MAIVEWKKDGTVAIMILNNGENRHNPVWAEAMLSTHAEIMADPEIKSMQADYNFYFPLLLY